MSHGELHHDDHEHHGHGPGCGDCLPQDAASHVDHDEHIHTGPGCCGEVDHTAATEHVDHVHDEHCGHVHHERAHEHVDHGDDHSDEHHHHHHEPSQPLIPKQPEREIKADVWQSKPVDHAEAIIRQELDREGLVEPTGEPSTDKQQSKVESIVNPVNQPNKPPVVKPVETIKPKVVPKTVQAAKPKPEPPQPPKATAVVHEPVEQAEVNVVETNVAPKPKPIAETSPNVVAEEAAATKKAEPSNLPEQPEISLTPATNETFDDKEMPEQPVQFSPEAPTDLTQVQSIEQPLPAIEAPVDTAVEIKAPAPAIEAVVDMVENTEIDTAMVAVATEQVVTIMQKMASIEKTVSVVTPEMQTKIVQEVVDVLQMLGIADAEEVILRFAKTATVVEWQDMLLKLYEELQGEDRFERGLKGLATFPVSDRTNVMALGKLIMRRLTQGWSLAC